MKRALPYLALAILLFVGFRVFFGGGERASSGTVVEAIESGATVIDVRSDGEWAQGHVAGALHVPVGAADFEARVDALDRSEPVYVYCASGVRSGRAARTLEGMGFERVVNAGGLSGLAAAGAPVER